MKVRKVGVKLPEVGTPSSVEGIDFRVLGLAVDEGLAENEGEGLGVADGETSPEGVEVREGS
jgi:hypothetical protein